jgi:hypothetical protein
VIQPGVHLDNGFIDESLLTALEKGLKKSFYVAKKLVHEFILSSGRKLVVEIKFFDNYIEVIGKCIFNILADLLTKRRIDVAGLVAPFNFFYPDVEALEV